jgi:Excalibur calcium-binding domain
MSTTRSLLAILLIMATLSTLVHAKPKRFPRVCKAYPTHQAAQKVFVTDKRYYRNLDRDRDGLACECNLGGPGIGKRQCGGSTGRR